VVGLRREGRLESVAPLAHRRLRAVTQVVALGHGPSDELRLPARDADGAAALAVVLGEALQTLPRPYRLKLRHLSPQESAVAAVVDALPHVVTALGDVSPRLRLGGDRELRGYVTRNHHQQTRRLHNRIRTAGLRLEVRQLADADDVQDVLPAIEATCRERDLALRGHSGLDDPAYARFFRNVIIAHARLGQVELTTLRLDGDLAAYVLCFRDGSTWRMWHTRVRPRWQKHGAGRLATDAAVQAALRDPECGEFDWMRGAEKYKFSLSDHVYRSADLYACSTAPIWWVSEAARQSRGRLRDLRDAHPSLSRRWQDAQRLLAKPYHLKHGYDPVFAQPTLRRYRLVGHDRVALPGRDGLPPAPSKNTGC